MAQVTARELRQPDAPVHGTLFQPAGAPPCGVLAIGGSGGSEPSYLGAALAAQGIAALSVAYFARPGLPGELRDIPLEYFFAALDLLRAGLPPEVPAAVLGMSRGSEAAVLTAVHHGGDAVLLTVPGDVVAGSFPAEGGAAWLLDGAPVPFAPGPRSALPVERVAGPVFLAGAGADRVWPSAAMAGALAARLRERGHPYGHVLAVYPEAGHTLGYLVPELPAGLVPPGLADGPAERAARADAFGRAVEFLRQLPRPRSGMEPPSLPAGF